MEEIRALVPSQNEVKVQAVQMALSKFYDDDPETHFEAYAATFPINSGVRAQPLTLSETAYGVLNRLSAIKIISGFAIYAAIESGAFKVGDRWYESACAGVEIANAKPCVAYGPAFPVPQNIARHLEAELDLNEAMEIETGLIDAGSGEGFNGWITEGSLTRRDASTEAVLLALYGAKYEKKLR